MKKSITRRIFLFLAFFSILFLVIYIFAKENSRKVLEFYLEGETDYFVRYTPLTPPGLNAKDHFTSQFKVTNLISYGSKISLVSGNTILNRFVPNGLNHIFEANFGHTAETININFSNSQEVVCLPNPDNNGTKPIDSLPEWSNYNFGLIFFDSIANAELWKLDTEKCFSNFFVKGFDIEDSSKQNIKYFNSLSVIGNFNTDSLLPLEPPFDDYLDIRGFPLFYNEQKVLDKIQLLPRLNLRFIKDTFDFVFYISKVSLSRFKGSIFINGEKIELGDSRLNINKIENIGSLTLRNLPQKFGIKLKASSSEIEIDGNNIVKTYGNKFSVENPILFSTIISIVSAFLISLIISKGRNITEWLFPTKKP